MGSTLRLVAFDLRRHRALAVAVLAFEIVLALMLERIGTLGEAWALSRGDVELAEHVTLPLVTAGLNALVTAILVLADRPHDDRAFWRTRPIAPARLALAKAATLAVLLVALPSIVTTVRLAWRHAPAAAMGAAAMQIAVVAGQMMAPAWWLALATRRVALFVPAAILTGFAYVAVGLAVVRASNNPAYTEGAIAAGAMDDIPWSTLRALDWQREDLYGWPIAALLGAAGVLALIHHYRHRQVAFPLASILALMIGPGLWPYRMPDTPPDAALLQRLVGHVTAPAALDTRTPEYYAATGPWESASFGGRIGLPPLPRNISASIETGPVRLRTSDRTLVASGVRQCCDGVGPVGLLDADAKPKRPFHWGFKLPITELPRLAGSSVDIDAPATVRLSRHMVVGRFTAATGATFHTDRYRIEIVEGLGTSPAMRGRPVAALRLVLFPTLRPAGDCYLWLLGRWRDRITHVAPEWWGNDSGEYLFTEVLPCSTWSGGRRWLTRWPELHVSPGEPIVVVESYPAGVMRTTLAATGVPVVAVD